MKFTRAELKLLGVLAFASFFDYYDQSILALALPRLQASLGVGDAAVGPALGLVRAGALPVVALTVLADRVGRRRLLLASLAGFTLCTAASAFVTSAAAFFALQTGTRFFAGAEALLTVVVLTEELADERRGAGVAILGALGAAGAGAAAIAFGAVDLLPGAWRGLYLVGVVPLLVLGWLRRGIPETRHFLSSPPARSLLAPLRDAIAADPRRTLVVAALVVPLELAQWTAYILSSKHLQDVHGYAPGDVTVLFVIGGTIATLTTVAVGHASDRVGRRAMLAAIVVLDALATLGLYNLDGPLVAVAWVALIFGNVATLSVTQVLGAELFPTTHRATAAGLRLMLTTIGGAAGLALEGVLYQVTGSHAAAVSWIAVAQLVALPALLALPETARSSLT